MKEIKIKANLSIEQLQKIRNQVERIKLAYKEASSNFVEQATQTFYDYVVLNCSVTGKYNKISNPETRIQMEYDKTSNIGRVYSSDYVIIFNEFGTGVNGTQDDWADKHGYQVNLSGKGEKGWWYPTDENDSNPFKYTDKSGQLRAFTQGLDSGHMFYDALLDLQDELKDIVEVSFGKTIDKNLGDLY